MLIPLRHENMQGRRWPVITFGIIALNVIVFLGTHWTIDRQGPELGQVKLHLILLAAMHPELKVPEKAQEFVTYIQTKNAAVWKEAQNPNRDVLDVWDAKIRMQDDPDALQQEMDSLGDSYAELNSASLLSKYAFIPAHPTLLGLLTANFLHGGWLHLIGNMWFLWLAGAILEDTWGRLIYPAFYLIAGVLAFQVHAMVNVGKLHADDWRFGSHRRTDGRVPGAISHDKNRDGLFVFLPLLPVQDGRVLAAAAVAADGNSLWLGVWPDRPASRIGRTSAASHLGR